MQICIIFIVLHSWFFAYELKAKENMHSGAGAGCLDINKCACRVILCGVLSNVL